MDFYEICEVDNPLFLDASPEQKREIINIGAQVVASFSHFGTTYEPHMQQMRKDLCKLETLKDQQAEELARCNRLVNALREREIMCEARIEALTDQLCECENTMGTLQARVNLLETELAETRLKEYIKKYFKAHHKTPTCREVMHDAEMRAYVKKLPAWRSLKQQSLAEMKTEQLSPKINPPPNIEASSALLEDMELVDQADDRWLVG